MGELEAYFSANPGRLLTKWRHYFEIYERHFAPFRGRDIRLLEFGVWHGGSLQMWRHYFGPRAHIVGVDSNPSCAQLAEPGIDIVIGDQVQPETHRQLRERYGPFDIVIDDGGHTMAQQITTFRELYPAVKPGGLYLAEDLHTSYQPPWGGGLGRPGTFIEFAKQLVDQLHAWYGPPPGLEVDYITRMTFALHFYDSMLVLEKRRIDTPRSVYSGKPTLPLSSPELQSMARMDQDAGRPDVALALYRKALKLTPEDEALWKLVASLEGGAP